jgi:hypothetical protein
MQIKVGIEESIVNAPRITDHAAAVSFKSNLTFCVVCAFALQTDKWRSQSTLQRQL